jgi:hypothetical protein
MAEKIMPDLWRNFWLRETGTDQQVAQLHDIYDNDDDDDDDINDEVVNFEPICPSLYTVRSQQ